MVSLSPQQWEIYLLLKENRGRLTGVSEFTQADGLNIASYTERISELRRKGFVIDNVEKNYYALTGEPEPSIDDLKIIWTMAKKRGYEKLMKRCEQKAKQVKFVQQVQDTLL